MKILLVHNKYGKPSGEEFMVESIDRILSSRGHTVKKFYKESADIESIQEKIGAAFTSFYSNKVIHEIKDLLLDFSPDIVQIQNVFPLISAHVFPVVKAFGFPIVFRCANYRLFCPTGLMIRGGRPCEKCACSSHLNCVLHNCENDILRSLLYGLRNEYGRLRNLIRPNCDAFIVPSKFQKQKFEDWGISKNRISVLPNPLPSSFHDIKPPERQNIGDYIGYAGRISPEKGILFIVRLAKLFPEIPFKMAGHGNSEYINSLNLPNNLEYLGMLESDALHDFYLKAKFLLMPSQWYETFGLVAIEAMKCNTPVIASNIGALGETIRNKVNGYLCDPYDFEDFASRVKELWYNDFKLRRLQLTTASSVNIKYSDDSYGQSLEKIYYEIL